MLQSLVSAFVEEYGARKRNFHGVICFMLYCYCKNLSRGFEENFRETAENSLKFFIALSRLFYDDGMGESFEGFLLFLPVVN
jgi:hypothetical protein